MSGPDASTSDSPSEASPSAVSPSALDPAPVPEATGIEIDGCALLNDDELETLAGEVVGGARPGMLPGGMPNCRWSLSNGSFIQVIAASASDWARSLPEALRAIEATGAAIDPDQVKALRDAARLVEGGGQVEPDEACELFSQMLELRGEEPGQDHTLNVVPSRDDPHAVNGQMCSDGRFTSVMIASDDGLTEPLPMQLVIDATQIAHGRARL